MSLKILAFSVRRSKLMLKELNAALLAGLMLAFAVVWLWLFFAPSLFLVGVLMMILGAGVLLAIVALRLVLHPPRTLPRATPASVGIAQWETVQFAATDGIKLSAWFIPPAAHSSGATVILVHGMSANKSDCLSDACLLAHHGYGALLIDLRNHGESGDALTTLGYHEVQDIRGAVDFLLSRPEVNPKQIGIMGYSMGGATAICATARIPQIRAVIAQSTFASLQDSIEAGMLAQVGLPPFPFAPLLIWLGERTTGLRVRQVQPLEDIVRIYPRAVMLIHGTHDQNISPDNSRRLYAAAYEPKVLYLIEAGEHQLGSTFGSPEYENKIIAFLDDWLRDVPNGTPKGQVLCSHAPVS